MKFTIDATQDRCVAAVHGFRRTGEWDDIVAFIGRYTYPYVCLDGIGGRLSYLGKDEHNEDEDGSHNIVVVDVA